MNTAKKGKEGEDRAVRYLKDGGYTILRRNYRKRTGEIDVIAEMGEEIIFLEIKCWSGYDEMQLENIVNQKKRRRIIQTARSFLSDTGMGENRRLRFDVILLDGQDGSFHHYENAFTESGVV